MAYSRLTKRLRSWRYIIWVNIIGGRQRIWSRRALAILRLQRSNATRRNLTAFQKPIISVADRAFAENA
jgi:hypothetical protein